MEPNVTTEPLPVFETPIETNLMVAIDAVLKPKSMSVIDATACKINALCDQIEELASSVVQNCQHNSIQSIGDQHALLHASTSAFSRLRSLNRTLYEEQTSVSKTVNELKTSVDKLALDLENVQREQMFIRREITLTQKLETVYQNIPIISEDEFKETAPEEFLKDTENPHTLMLNRLRFEIKQREMLMEEKKNMKVTRNELRLGKRKRNDHLEEIDGQLRKHVGGISKLSKRLSGEKVQASADERQPTSSSIIEEGEEGEEGEDDSEHPPKRSRALQSIRDADPSRIDTPRL